MSDWRADFGPFDGRTWLNCAHQGPLPWPAIDALDDAVAWKRTPHRLSDETFWEVPARLKRALGTLLDASPDEIVLGNSLSHGLHALVHGLDWSAGDEVLLVEDDFPATILPWRLLEDRGVRLRFVDPSADAPLEERVSAALTDRTRVFCATWVDSFTGHRLDPDALGEACRATETLFVLNGSQGVGARPIDVSGSPIDALASCGYKWLCGPYGTGFAWVDSELLAALEPTQAYWLPMQKGTPLDRMRDLPLRTDLGAANFDVFGTANFNNFVPWTASIEYLNDAGIDRIAAHGERLVARLIDGVPDAFEVVTPADPERRANIVVLRPSTAGTAEGVYEELSEAGFDVALREGNLRISPHLYNTRDEIDRFVDELESLSTGS